MFSPRSVLALVGILCLQRLATARPVNATVPRNVTVSGNAAVASTVVVSGSGIEPSVVNEPNTVTMFSTVIVANNATMPSNTIVFSSATVPGHVTVFVTNIVTITKPQHAVALPPPTTVAVLGSGTPSTPTGTSVNLLSTSFPTALRTILYPTHTGKYNDVSALWADADITLLPSNLRSIVTEQGHRPTIAPELAIPLNPMPDMGGSPDDKWPLPDIEGPDKDPKPQEPILWAGNERRILREAINAGLHEVVLARAAYRRSHAESDRLWSLFRDKCDWAPEDCTPPNYLLRSTWDQAEAADEVAKRDLRRLGAATWAVLVARRAERDWQDRMQRSWGDAHTTGFLLVNGPPSIRVEEPTGMPPVRAWEGGVGRHKGAGW